jgi:type IV secretion system protein VirB9
MIRAFITAVVLLCAGLHSAAAMVPTPGPVDPRIRTIVYNPREVVTILGQPGFQIMVEFGPNERIENISIGDSLAWQVTPNRRANLLFLKPLDPRLSTNMTVVTNQRRYAFDLVAMPATRANHRRQIYTVQFLYPNEEIALSEAAPIAEEPVSDGLPPESWNFAYSYTGDKTHVPARVFDDGKFTYFQWLDGTSTPAVFMVNPDGTEALVNHSQRGRYFVVEQVARQFVLRSGQQVTRVFNDALAEPTLGAAAPRPRTEAKPERRGLGSIFQRRRPQ